MTAAWVFYAGALAMLSLSFVRGRCARDALFLACLIGIALGLMLIGVLISRAL